MLNVRQSLPKSKDLFSASLYEPHWVGHPILASPAVHQVRGEPENEAGNILALWIGLPGTATVPGKSQRSCPS